MQWNSRYGNIVRVIQHSGSYQTDTLTIGKVLQMVDVDERARREAALAKMSESDKRALGAMQRIDDLYNHMKSGGPVSNFRGGTDWIQTYTGKQFWPLDPRAEEVDIRDIAHALSLTCRYTGHCKKFYSVAQHCVLMAMYAPSEFAREVLLHDAAEAYMADVARPVKKSIPQLKEIEVRLEACIAERFGLRFPWPEVVGILDLQALATERRDLMATPPIPWKSTVGVEPFPDTIEPWSPDKAETIFLNWCDELEIE